MKQNFRSIIKNIREKNHSCSHEWQEQFGSEGLGRGTSAKAFMTVGFAWSQPERKFLVVSPRIRTGGWQMMKVSGKQKVD